MSKQENLEKERREIAEITSQNLKCKISYCPFFFDSISMGSILPSQRCCISCSELDSCHKVCLEAEKWLIGDVKCEEAEANKNTD